MTGGSSYEPYEPQSKPVAWGKDIWIVEGPVVQYRAVGLKIPCPTRMTIIRLSCGGLWLHSPIVYSRALHGAIAQLGSVVVIIAPNSYHHLNIDSWAAAYPTARIFAVPCLAKKFVAAERLSGQAWSPDIASSLVKIGSFEEAVFLHNPSRTLIVTDLMQRFEPARVGNPLLRLILRAVRATGPTASPSIELWPFTANHRRTLASGVRQMLQWHPQSIILAHGPCITDGAPAEIERAFGFFDFTR
jgi:Domain of unknown function (DUF4336)